MVQIYDEQVLDYGNIVNYNYEKLQSIDKKYAIKLVTYIM